MAAFRTPITSVALLPLVAAICEIIASVAPILPASSLQQKKIEQRKTA
jgi:hypothetical protein